MRREFPRTTPAEPLLDVQQRLAAASVPALLVVEGDDRLVGLLTLADVGEAYRFLSIRPELVPTLRSSRTASRSTTVAESGA
jgi:hypothetical protein